MADSTGGAGVSSSATITESCDMTGLPRLIQHLKEPHNLLNYMIFTAYMKYMEVFSWVPTITIGG